MGKLIAMRQVLLGGMLASLAFAAFAAEAPRAAPAAPAAAAPIEKCGVVYAGADGSLANMMMPSLHVLELADDASFQLPADAPPNVKGVTCGRESLIPARNDYKVLGAGIPLTIIHGERLGALTIVDGHLRFQMLKGEMTELEMPKIGAYLDAAQLALNKQGK